MKKELVVKVEGLLERCCKRFDELVEEYEEMYQIDLNHPTITFYTIDVCYDYSELSGFIDTLNGSKMLTLQTIFGHTDPDIEDDYQVIETISSQVLMSYQSVFEVILDCNMNFEDAERYLIHVMRHEIGHILDRNIRFVGKYVKEWNDAIDFYEKQQKEFNKKHKLRKNASTKSARQWIIDYHHLIDEEVNANRLAKIDDQQIIEAFEITHKSF